MTASSDLLAALDMVAFARQPDGTFRALAAETPPWFRTLGRDATFPFLGNFLESASAFWAASNGAGGERCLWSGPCAETDEDGREFHYEVAAVSTPGGQYLVFERRPEVEAMQHVLQKARELTLEHERVNGRLDNLRATQAGALAELAQMAQTVADEVVALRASLLPDRQPVADRLAAASARLVAGLETTLRSLGQRRQ
jgi:hypothetical protein